MKKYFIVFTLSLLMSERLIGAEAGMPQLDPKYWASQAFWLILIFLTIYLLIAKIFIPKIKGNIDTREDKMRKDLEEAKTFREEAEKKLKLYEELIKKAKLESKKIISNSRQKLNEDIQSKKESVQKQIEQEILKAEKEIKKFKLDSIHKVGSISENIVSDLLIDIFGEDGNKSSIKATVSEVVKQRVTKI
jgi:F-type H+-transporting ATPase subunit b|tara:strand:+ start:143 stop:715 length:573 start_codon:yes stop_codon:yes gene_type:complete